MADLAEFRKKIDEIDAQMVRLYEERMAVSDSIADYKIQTGRKVFDAEREREKLASLKSMTHNPFNSTGIEELYEQIMAMSRKLQYQKLAAGGATGRLPFICIDGIDKEGARVVYQGAEGSYSQAAMFSFFGRDVKNFHVETFRDAMDAIEEGAADYAVLPVENSTAGIVGEIYDLLSEYENYIIAEQTIRIEHCLIGVPGASVDDIRTVYSHPQSLMQCSAFLRKHPGWQLVSMKNNAFAAKKVRDDGDISQAAIAGRPAAEYYNMDVLEQGINMNHSNSTRFIIVTNQKVFLRDASKISICFEVKHETGSLYHMMSHFIYNNLNMTKIESRPIEDRDWEYIFFIDFEGNLADSGVKSALRGLREEARNLRVLGNY